MTSLRPLRPLSLRPFLSGSLRPTLPTLALCALGLLSALIGVLGPRALRLARPSHPVPTQPLALTPLPSPAHALPEAFGDATLLRHAITEARGNCRLARAFGERSGRFRVEAIQAALQSERMVRASYGELPALLRELEWLAQLEGPADLEGRSPDDLRFLTGAIHWYLECAQETRAGDECHLDRALTHDPRGLVEFAGLDYGDLLSQWD